MQTIGYIVQFYDEDSVSPHGTGKQLYRRFEDALHVAKDLANQWMDFHYTPSEGPIHYYTPKQSDIDNRISGLVFSSVNVLIWIEILFEKLEGGSLQEHAH